MSKQAVCSALLLCLLACDQPAAPARSVVQAGVVVDSILAPEEEVRRFKVAHHARRTDELANSVHSRDQLVHEFISALEKGDSAALVARLLDPAEFIDLYYPASPYARPPYRQNPAFVWFQLQQNSRKGITRALNRYSGQPSSYRGYRCDPDPIPLGNAFLWQNCIVQWGLEPTELRLFGSIIENAGAFKFVSFANDL